MADSAATRDRSLVDWLKDFKDTIGGDPLFERLVSQIWSVHRANVKDNSTVYGTQIDPIEMDKQMGPMDIPIQQGWITSKARVEGIEIHGLSSMSLDHSTMKRKEHLEDLNMDVTFKFDQIYLNGTYRVETMGIWVIGGNHFSIGLTRCFISYLMHMALLDMVATPETDNEERANKCTEGSEPDVQLLDLSLPLDCLALDFNFFGLADSLVEFLGLTIVKQIMGFATNVAREKVNFLLCS